MKERSVQSLVIYQEHLNHVRDQRKALNERLGYDSPDFSTSTPREIRMFGIKTRVRASIDRIDGSLSQVSSQLEEYLPQIAKNYRLTLLRKERDLRSIERSGIFVPEETLTGFRSQLQELRDKPQGDPILAKALEIKIEQKTQPAPVHPEAPAAEIQEGATAENETKPAHKIVVNLIEDKKSVDGRDLAIKSPIQNATFMQLARNPGKDFTEAELTEIAKKAGSKNPRAGGMMVFYLRRILETDPKNPTILIKTENGYQLNAEVEIIEEEGEKAPKKDTLRTGKSEIKPKREIGQKVNLILPDGQEVTVTKIQAGILGLLPATKEKAITYEEWASPLWQEEKTELSIKINRLSVHKTALNRKILQEKGYQIANADESQFGIPARFYLEKTLVSEKTDYPQQPDIKALQEEISELQSRIQSIEGRIEEGDLTEKSNPMLDALHKALDEKKAELVIKEELLESLPVSSPEGTKNLPAGGENNDIIPYQRPPETIRTTEETNFLTFIADELSKYDRLWFDRIQNGLNAYQNPSRYATIGGLNRRRFKPYGANELKQLLARAIKKMEDDSQIPLRRKDWNSEDESTWTKLQNLIQRIGEGDERRFIQRVNGLIDKASNEYYAMHPEIKPGEDWII